jgi:hypothetical protein
VTGPLASLSRSIRIVNRHVSLELIWPRESFPTPSVGAGKWPFTGICDISTDKVTKNGRHTGSDVLGQVGSLDETLVTVRTDEWFLAIMSPLSQSATTLVPVE